MCVFVCYVCVIVLYCKRVFVYACVMCVLISEYIVILSECLCCAYMYISVPKYVVIVRISVHVCDCE